jgi:hypothetical protein
MAISAGSKPNPPQPFSNLFVVAELQIGQQQAAKKTKNAANFLSAASLEANHAQRTTLRDHHHAKSDHNKSVHAPPVSEQGTTPELFPAVGEYKSSASTLPASPLSGQPDSS